MIPTPHLHRRTALALVLSFSWLLSACVSAAQVGELKPRPNVNWAPAQRTMSLHFGRDVADGYTLPETELGSVVVTDWRNSLTNAFLHSFGRSLPPTGSKPDLAIRLLRAELVLTSTDGVARSNGIRAEIRYQANLIDKNNNVARRTDGTATSRHVVTSRARLPTAITSAIEGLFEQLKTELLQP